MVTFEATTDPEAPALRSKWSCSRSTKCLPQQEERDRDAVSAIKGTGIKGTAQVCLRCSSVIRPYRVGGDRQVIGRKPKCDTINASCRA